MNTIIAFNRNRMSVVSKSEVVIMPRTLLLGYKEIERGFVEKWLAKEGEPLDNVGAICYLSDEAKTCSDQRVAELKGMRMLQIFVKEGEVVPVGTILCVVGSSYWEKKDVPEILLNHANEVYTEPEDRKRVEELVKKLIRENV